MNFLLVTVVLILAVSAEESIRNDYHETVGIPMAARIREAEAALDFDGSRISGGQVAALGTFPYFAGLLIMLLNGRQSVCGSTIVSRTKLVTAAHCWRTDRHFAHHFVVVMGSVRLFSGGVRQNTNRVEMHADYNSINLNYDIAIITLINPVTFNNNIGSINIASGSNNFNGVWASAVGFGMTSDSASIGTNQVLSHVNMQVIANNVCAQVYGSNVVIDSTLCVATTGGKSTCGGDSGGPLTVGTGNNRQLIGVTSFSHINGCTRGHPAGFVRVTALASWINARI
ncbi:collagenase-like [Danaus plexippus]|uniref:collagenase-like n=1 Tax=Danaus plexippus TaxID=13037 RepID=UPI002AB0E9AA|nr:collagenase-like [Danaus plexippus]